MSFYNTTYLFLLLLVPLVGVILVWRESIRKKAREKFATESLLRKYAVIEPPQRNTIRLIFVAIACGLFLIAFARPQGGERTLEEEVEGIDIMIAMDISRSMLARDLNPDRLTAIKEVVYDFIDSSIGDRIGIVAFAGDATVVCPLTTDHGSVYSFIDRLTTNEPLRPGTAIGDAIYLSTIRFRESDTGRVVILLTDGESNKGMEPAEAANYAKENGVRIYTVGIGTPQGAPLPEAGGRNIFGNERYRTDNDGQPIRVGLDERTLREVADITEGEYFSVANMGELRTLYSRITHEGETKFQTRKMVRKDELAPYFILIGCLLLIAESFYNYMAPGEINVLKRKV
ncbi:MAG TPA: VWA domain-containing protein [bacterium]|jgi:Ca-activated chloride channel family protein